MLHVRGVSDAMGIGTIGRMMRRKPELRARCLISFAVPAATDAFAALIPLEGYPRIRTSTLSLIILAAFSLSAHAEISGRATVIDGDTIAVEGTEARIRLYGIDAPEGGQTCDAADGTRYLCGGRAADALAGMIGRNGRVRCVEEDRDRYGRIVAECVTQSNVTINAAMVANGWALEYDEYSDGRYDQDEENARAAKKGIWAGKFVEPWDWRRGERLPSEIAAQDPIRERLEDTRVAQRQSCKAVSTCEDAVRMWCGGYTRADGDQDGIPCENVCGSTGQVDDIRARIGC